MFKAQRFSWFGNISRMSESSIVKKIYKLKPFTSRPVGRPKSRWEDDVRNDLKKGELIQWTEQVHDRLKWKVIFEKAKTLPEFDFRKSVYHLSYDVNKSTNKIQQFHKFNT